MEINKMIKTIKEIHKNYIVMIKMGNFYHVYGKDTYIISYLFDYKIITKNNIYVTAFPMNSINKVIAKLEDLKINYLILDKRNNYDVDEKSDYEKQNNYLKYYEKSRRDALYKIRVEKIYNYMKENIKKKDCKNLILEVERQIDERGKVSSN